jgi:hypothetical protein
MTLFDDGFYIIYHRQRPIAGRRSDVGFDPGRWPGSPIMFLRIKIGLCASHDMPVQHSFLPAEGNTNTRMGYFDQAWLCLGSITDIPLEGKSI